ncbi:hypothetical protein PCE1_001615 [Barthelona sp. PCE]
MAEQPNGEFQKLAAQQAQLQQEQAQQDEQVRGILSRILDKDALDRLNRLRLVKPDEVRDVSYRLAEGVKRGAFNPPVSDDQLVRMLDQLGVSNTARPKIRIIRR